MMIILLIGYIVKKITVKEIRNTAYTAYDKDFCYVYKFLQKQKIKTKSVQMLLFKFNKKYKTLFKELQLI